MKNVLKAMMAVTIVAAIAAHDVWAQPDDHARSTAGANSVSVDRGRYLVRIMGCNDCHTSGFVESGGQLAERQWLTGDSVGHSGPWGTTYGSNLRLYFAGISEEQWVRTGRTLGARPPMPWFNVRAMSNDDLRSMYRYMRWLGPAGEPAPKYLPPGTAPQGAVVRYPEPPATTTSVGRSR